MTFKEQFKADLNEVFFNLDEFAEDHKINGSIVNVVVDNDTLAELFISRQIHTEQIFTDAIMFYVRKCDLGFEPVPGQYIDYDDRGYLVTDVKTDDEAYTVILGANEV